MCESCTRMADWVMKSSFDFGYGTSDIMISPSTNFQEMSIDKLL